jgi:hypothetical protein
MSVKGQRFGGRAKGTPNKATAEIKMVARQYGREAISLLAQMMRSAADAKVRVMAASALLDRGYGKSAQTLTGDPEKPLEHNLAVVDEFTRKMAAMAEKMRA